MKLASCPILFLAQLQTCLRVKSQMLAAFKMFILGGANCLLCLLYNWPVNPSSSCDLHGLVSIILRMALFILNALNAICLKAKKYSIFSQTIMPNKLMAEHRSELSCQAHIGVLDLYRRSKCHEGMRLGFPYEKVVTCTVRERGMHFLNRSTRQTLRVLHLSSFSTFFLQSWPWLLVLCGNSDGWRWKKWKRAEGRMKHLRVCVDTLQML